MRGSNQDPTSSFLQKVTALSSARAEAEWGALRRGFTQAITSLELGRKKWAKLSDSGKLLLTAYTNGQVQQMHAEHRANWVPQLRGSAGLRRGVALRALEQQRMAQVELAPLMEELEDVVARMSGAVATLRSKLTRAATALGAAHTEDAPLFRADSPAQLGKPLALPRAFSAARPHLLTPRVTAARSETRGGRGRCVRAGDGPAPQPRS